MSNAYKWAVEDIFSSVEEWNNEFNEVSKNLDFSGFKGKLSNADDFLACMKAQEKVGRIIEKLSVYAMMKHDENTKDALYDSLLSKITSLGATLGANSAFITPELTALPEETLIGFINDPKLKEYDYLLKEILKDKPHVLSENEEKLLALSSETLGSFRDIFTKIDNADLPLGELKHGKERIPLSHGTYGVIMHGEDRKLRKKTLVKPKVRASYY